MMFRLIIQTKFFKQAEDKEYTFDIFKLFQAKDRNEVYTMFLGEAALKFYGSALLDISLDGPVLFGDFPIESESKSHFAARMVNNSFTWVIQFLWFIRDNSCNALNTIYIAGKDSTYLIESHDHNSTAEGDFRDVEFTLKEWKESISLFHKYIAISRLKSGGKAPKLVIKEEDITGFQFRKVNDEDTNYNDNNRIERAVLFIVQARRTTFLPAKISFYVLVLECLFSANDMGEIKYKMGLRVSSFLGGSKKFKKESFDFVQLTYKVRSKYLHGQKLEGKTKRNEDLMEISKKIDSLLRKIMRRVLDKPESFLEENQEKFTIWLDSLTFK